MLNWLYLQVGIFNIALVLIVYHRARGERDRFRDCRLFGRLLLAALLVNTADTAGWLLDGRLTGAWSTITNLVDCIDLIATACVCWCWVQYVQFLSYDDAGVPGRKNYFSTILFAVQSLAVLAALPTSFFYTIDAQGVYTRGQGYGVFLALCLAQLIYSVVLCLVVRHRVKDPAKRKELWLIGLVILLPVAGTLFQGFFYGYPLIWMCMTVLLVIVCIHIQDKRRSREVAEQQEQLRLALHQAQYASKAKTDFLSNMSHDIRTPMNAIVGFAAIAAGHIDEQEIVRDSLEKILSSSKHLLNLINDVLDMSRIESGKMHLQIAPCNLAVLMHDLVDMVQSQIRAAQLELFVDTLHVQDEEVLTDAMKLNQILINLVGNAIKFNKPGGLVSLRVEQIASAQPGCGSYIFTVRDTGCGIAPEYQAHIFEPFERGVQDAKKDSVEGTGLGLAIVKNIVNMMDGSIDVTSEADKGSEFRVELCMKLQNREEAEQRCDGLRGLRTLVVDDDFNTCDSVTTMLSEIGMDAEWTLTGREAVLKAKKAAELRREYSAYIIDWLMPDMNGIEVTRRIRSVIGPDVPIFILTAYEWSDIEKEAREAGVTAFCRKPLFMSELRQTLLECAGLAQERPVEAHASLDAAALRGRRILLVEDHPLNREIAVRLLTDKGLRVEEAEDGSIALEKFKLSRPGYYDVILMDIRMPNMDGYQATDAIRALARADAQTTPIIAMTANAFEEDKRQALAHGMNAHLAKPLNVQALFEVIGRCLSDTAAQDEQTREDGEE